VTGSPRFALRCRVLSARRRVAWCRARAASRSRSTRSAILSPLGAQRLQGGDDLVEVDQHRPVVGGLPSTAGALGGPQELAGEFGLLLVDGQELGGRLEIRAGQTCIGVRAVLLGRPAAVAVGQGVGGAGESVFDPLAVRGDRLRIEAEQAGTCTSTRVWRYRSNSARMVVSCSRA